MDASLQRDRVRRGFTLVELMVVIVIIGILVALVVNAVIAAQIKARNAVIAIEVNNLDMAMKAYKEQYGAYPPDFAGINNTNNHPNISGVTIQSVARGLVIRHLRKAFPRYVLGNPSGSSSTTDWDRLRDDVSTFCNSLDINYLTPDTALAFWFGGPPAAGGSTKLRGFSANPANPFYNGSFLDPLFEFDDTRLTITYDSDGKPTSWAEYAPAVSAGTDPAPYVYFRARSGGYDTYLQTFSSNTGEDVIPYGVAEYDESNSKWVPDYWLNPKTFQVICAGLDGQYGGNYAFPLVETSGTPGMGTKTGYEFDNLTNFSNGILEDWVQ